MSRDKKVMVRVDSVEKSALEAGAKACGRRVPAWLRELGLSAARGEETVQTVGATVAPIGEIVPSVPVGVQRVVWEGFLGLLESVPEGSRSGFLAGLTERGLIPLVEDFPSLVTGRSSGYRVGDGPELVRGRELDQTHRMDRVGRGPVRDMGPGDPDEERDPNLVVREEGVDRAGFAKPSREL